MMRRLLNLIFISTTALVVLAAQPPTMLAQAPLETTGQDGPLPLSAYPRPKNDNGMGIHWSSTPYGEEPETTDYFVAEIKAMGIKWVKFLNDQTEGRHHDYLVQQLVANDIMPIARIYIGCNDPLDLGSLGRMVDHYVPMGLYYFELYNEPDIRGRDGGWCDDPDPDPEHLARVWAPAAREIQARGGYSSLPSIFPMGKNVQGWENSFFQRFLQAIKNNGDAPVLYRSWGAVHNYFINHPPDYPLDEVNLTGRLLTAEEITRYHLTEGHVQAINQARMKQSEPGGYYVGNDPILDVTGFLQFIGYHNQFVELFGFEIPLISTEGGATVGSCEDPRYPCVDEKIQMEWTLASYEYMLDEAPEYYFANCTWLIALKALDFGGGTVWESNAWYHDRKGNHLPVVNALKNHPRKGQVRWDQGEGPHIQPAADRPTFASLTPNSETISTLSALGGLAQYPRPQGDNGRGVHYAPTIMGQPTGMVDFFVTELLAMNIKWVKIMQGDIPKIEHPYLVEQLVAHDIEPILRVYRPYNEPYEYLGTIVGGGVPLGIHYYELYNEPNIGGFPGGWHDGEAISVERMLELWLPAAEAIQNAGGYPGLPSLAAGGDYDDMVFLRTFLSQLAAQGRTDLLQRAWVPLHNYFFNHPFDYPTDPVNLQNIPLTAEEIAHRGLSVEQVQSINTARANARMPGGYYVGDTVHQDSNGFYKFDAYAKIFHDQFGFYIPIISTEGGPLTGDQQDPRYPAVTDEDVTNLTLRGYHTMLDSAPAYYFAFTPWLMANGAGGHWDAAWEGAAWYKMDGTTLPIVDALKNDPRRVEVRDWSYRPLLAPAPENTQPMTAADSSTEPQNPQSETQNPVAQIVPLAGPGPAQEVTQAEWQAATSPYPRLRVNLLNNNGQQVRVAWSDGWAMLVPEPGGSASMPLTKPDETYIISVAGGSGQAVQATGAEGYDLHVGFRQAAGAQ